MCPPVRLFSGGLLVQMATRKPPYANLLDSPNMSPHLLMRRVAEGAPRPLLHFP